MARTATVVVPQLPTYTARRSQDYDGWLIVTCPYLDCDQTFVVKKTRWMRKLVRRETEITGRSCPYCFRVAHLPKRITSA